MSINESSFTGSGSAGVVGDPLIGGPALFDIRVDASDHLSIASSHRPLVRGLTFINTGWTPTASEVVVSVHGELASGSSFLRPYVKAFPAPGVGDVISDGFTNLSLDLPTLVGLDEAEYGEIVVRISDEDSLLAEHRQRVDVLAYNQWFHSPRDFDSIAAFVFPSHPAIADIMSRVRDRLLRTTGSGATEGYQQYGAGPERGAQRVVEILAAIFEELQALQLEYSDPPASFEGYGQKIRTPDVILSEGVATCLDSSVLSASCIAAAGLSPLVFIVRGHAFPGAWLSEYTSIGESRPWRNPLRPSVVIDPNEWDLLSPLVVSFESTQICRSSAQSFAQSVNRHLDFSDGGGSRHEFAALIDVERASETGVRRLPARIRQADSEVFKVEIDRSAIEALIPDGAHLEDVSDGAPERERLSDGDVPRRVRRWMDALLSIENSNPLVNLKSAPAFLQPDKGRGPKAIQLPTVPGSLAAIEDRLMSGSGLKAICGHRLPHHLLTEPGDAQLTDHLANTGELSVAPIELMEGQIDHWRRQLQQAGNPPQQANAKALHEFEKLHEQEVSRRFKALKRHADATEAESATNQLFLTIGTMVWDSPGEGGRATKTVRSPMFIIPVRISGTAQTSLRITMDEGGEISPNYCLVEKLRLELGLKLRELESPNLDDAGIDVDHTIQTIRRQLSASKFASIRIEEECNLAVLDFATFRMWKDIRSNWKLFTQNTVVDHLINGSASTLLGDHAPFAGEPLTPFDCDESQLEAVRWALEGRSFVLEGPPGTGKSQTIANLIAASMAEGKRVLFVAEKAVALNSVAEKLEAIGLDPFCITMHHENTTPDSIRQQLQVALDFVGEDVSAQWQSESAVVASLQERLVAYRDAAVDTNPLGMTAISAAQEVIRLGEGPSIDVDTGSLDALGEHLDQVRSVLLQARAVVGASRVQPVSEWALSTKDSTESLNREQLEETVNLLEDGIQRCSDLRPLVEPLLESGNQFSPALRDVAVLFSSGAPVEPRIASEVLNPGWSQQVESVRSDAESLRRTYSSVFAFFKDEALRLDLGPQMSAANEAVSAGFMSRRRKAEALRGLVSPLAKSAVTQEPAEILTLLQQVSPARDALMQLAERARSIPHISIGAEFDPLNGEQLSRMEADANDLKSRAELCSTPEADLLRSLQNSGVSVEPERVDDAGKFVAAWRLLNEVLESTEASLLQWRANRTSWDALVESLPAWAAEAPQWAGLLNRLKILQHFAPLRAAGQGALVDSILQGDVELDDLYERFERGMNLASLSERLSAGALSTFDQQSFDRMVADFTRRDSDRRQLMKAMIPRQLSEARPFKPGVRTGAIGELERELGRKVRRVSMAKLIQQHGEMITRLAPCFLMSPEAVSRLLPADSHFFDIVVFDEASQIRVAAAIPAMGRAKSVIVVGDSQQMPPSKRIGQRDAAGNEEDSDDEVFADLESILAECSESNLPSLMLQCHFRSQHEGLIAFSNRNFYDGRLVTFPAPNTSRTTPVSWVDVPDGQFHRSGESKGTNPAEAAAVVAEIRRRLSDPEHAASSIGVVTFNEVQAGLISEMLENAKTGDAALSRALDHPEKKQRLFVVPLEKVQGDERDTIMLSVSYSYQNGDRTKVPPNWGPLTNRGGERRLNVAITRAKKAMVVFCSFDPNHVEVKTATHLGVPATVEFLKECRDAAQSNGSALRARDISALDRFRRDLLRRLNDAGIRAIENVGLSRFRIDIAVSAEDGDDQFLALLLDGEGWASRATPYDREILPVSILRLIGWRRIGRIWLKSAIHDPDQIVTLVRNELERERARVGIRDRLRSAGFEVRDDSSLARLGLDFAVRREGQTFWPLAVALHGPDLFAQFQRFEGEIPRQEQMRESGCFDALSLWLPDLLAGETDVVKKIEGELDRAESQAEYEGFGALASEEFGDAGQGGEQEKGLAGGSVSSSGVSAEPSATNPLLGSDLRQEFTDGRSLGELGGAEILGPGPGHSPELVKLAIDEVVEAEGPIMEKRLASIVAARFGLTRVRASRLEALVASFAHLDKTDSPFGAVYWPPSRTAQSWPYFRTCSEEITRQIDEVSPPELSNAMLEVVRMGGSASAEEIIRMVAQAFGRSSVTKTLRERLESVLSWVQERGELSLDGEYFTLR